MEPEAVLDLFDSFWFHLKIFENQSKPSPSSNPNPQTQQNPSKPFSTQLSIHSRSKSDYLLSISSSPDSVLKTTTLSDRVISIEIPQLQKPIENLNKKKTRFSKSLSELEFEEVKGFMDLGFVFSEEDRESRLVEIIPGLQRLGHETGNKFDHRGKEEEGRVGELIGPRVRPHLSEAWGVSEYRQKEESPLMKWRVPAISNEIDMKYSLKWWAHTVASAIR